MLHRIMVPSPDYAVAKLYASRMADQFGGVTIQNASGLWRNAAGEIVEDHGYLLFSATDDGNAFTDAVFMKLLAGHVATDLYQEAVYFDSVPAVASFAKPFDRNQHERIAA